MILLYVVIPVAAALVANQADALGAWIAAPIARWAARVRYADDPDRAAERAEDWAAQIEKSIPGSLFKLGFALGLAGKGLAAAAARRSRRATSARLISAVVTAMLGSVGTGAAIVLASSLKEWLMTRRTTARITVTSAGRSATLTIETTGKTTGEVIPLLEQIVKGLDDG